MDGWLLDLALRYCQFSNRIKMSKTGEKSVYFIENSSAGKKKPTTTHTQSEREREGTQLVRGKNMKRGKIT